MTTKDRAVVRSDPSSVPPASSSEIGAPVQMRQATAHLTALKREAEAAEKEAERLRKLYQAAHDAAYEKRRQVNTLTEILRDFPGLFGKAP